MMWNCYQAVDRLHYFLRNGELMIHVQYKFDMYQQPFKKLK
jgi:hypothetical protein